MIERDRVTRLLTAVGDPVRLEILFVLKGERMNVGDIASHFEISRPAVSHHLRVLREAGVLSREKEGQEAYYAVNKRQLVDELRQLADALEGYLR